MYIYNKTTKRAITKILYAQHVTSPNRTEVIIETTAGIIKYKKHCLERIEKCEPEGQGVRGKGGFERKQNERLKQIIKQKPQKDGQVPPTLIIKTQGSV